VEGITGRVRHGFTEGVPTRRISAGEIGSDKDQKPTADIRLRPVSGSRLLRRVRLTWK